METHNAMVRSRATMFNVREFCQERNDVRSCTKFSCAVWCRICMRTQRCKALQGCSGLIGHRC